MEVSILLPKATRRVENVMGTRAKMTSRNEIIRSFTRPQIFGSKIETSILFYTAHEFSAYILLMWACIRWLIATLTSIAVIALIYHNAVPRTQPWHSVIPGATLATAMWFSSTLLFGWYLQHYADYSLIYGSLGAAIALLVWMYMVSLVILVGAEFNAMLFPRAMLGKELTAISHSRA